MTRMNRFVLGLGLIALGLVATIGAQTADPFNESLLKPFSYRNVGPFRIGARTSDIAVPTSPAKAHLYTFYVSFWTGGVWKTTNNGTTFEPIFDAQQKLSIGDVTIAPSNPDIVWVGTGDAFTSRSSYRGDGVYKSTDAGKTWKNMGLPDSHHISRIAIHPTNPDIVYVAVMGHLYSENPERGVFRSTNGGASWEKVLYTTPNVGAIDLVMNPKDPSVLYAAMYEKTRLPWQMVNGGPGSGIYKTTDAGAHWTKLAGGLPSGRIGRIGLDIHLKNPDILYAVIENDNPSASAARAASAGRGAQPGVVPIIGGEVYRTSDGGQSWTKQNAADYDVSPKGPYYFSQLRVDPNDDRNLFITQDGYRHSTDGGKTWNDRDTFPRMFGDYRTLWIDPENSDRMISGSDGGIAITYDRGRTSDHYANIPVGEVYFLSVDNENPYNIYAGLQDHENWKGPSSTGLNRVTPNDWLAVGDGDGMTTLVDPADSRWLYTNREYGQHWRMDQKAGTRVSIMPRRTDPSLPPYRFLWETPIVISPHDSKTIYTGGQMLLRSIDRGDHWTEISPDLSTNPADKIFPSSEGGVPGGIPWFAISSISESPVTRGVIWAGTADGNVQVTRDDGKTWTNVTAKIAAAGGRADAWARVRASSHVAGRAYVAKNGYKYDDFKPYLYRTDDFGATWTAIRANLPDEPINVIYEDQRNQDLLFVGNDTGVFVSMDRGNRWVKMNNNMPNIPVHDLLIHPRERDLVLGSYGRDIWITNISALEELTRATLAEDVHLFSIKPTVQRITWSFAANDYLFGQRHASTPNEANGMLIRYYLKSAMPSAVVVVTDASGQEVARLPGTSTAGINTVMWPMRVSGGGQPGRAGAGAARSGPPPPNAAGAAATAGQAGRGRGGDVLDQFVPLGEYTVTLEAGATKQSQKAQITHTMGWTLTTSTPFIIR